MANKIEAIEGIGTSYAIKLRKAGIKSVEGLLKTGHNKSGRKTLAGSSGIDEQKILKWVNMADLFRIKGVGSETSELLEAAGIDTVKELRNRRADNLHATLVEVNKSKKLVRRVPSTSQVVSFVDYAKKLDPMVSH
jgi:predicted flap endonuclease-1-like 5' DNA nuclease